MHAIGSRRADMAEDALVVVLEETKLSSWFSTINNPSVDNSSPLITHEPRERPKRDTNNRSTGKEVLFCALSPLRTMLETIRASLRYHSP